MLPETNTLQIKAEIDLKTATRFEVEFKSGIRDAPPINVIFTGSELQVMDTKAPLSLDKGKRTLKLDVFIDRSVLEVFANETACITKTIAPLDAGATLEIRAQGGAANAKRIQAWPIKTIW